MRFSLALKEKQNRVNVEWYALYQERERLERVKIVL